MLALSITAIVVINSNKSYATVTYMYDKVKQDATTNGYGATYSGDHADTVTSTGTDIVGTKPIYYYTTSGHNNLHFADQCWQIIRTTDTGGVKLVYNGEYSSSTKCNNSGTARQIGKSKFNNSFNGFPYGVTEPLGSRFDGLF